MKRFWLVLLSLGLIAAFSTSAMAVDVKVSGEFYAAGMYMDNTSLVKDTAADGPSTAFYFQRLRLQSVFVVSPGLMLTTRLDAMERAWGAARSNVPLVTTNDTLSAGTAAENENIVIDLAYVTYISPIGVFAAGYQIDGAWGTVFADNSLPTGKVTYTIVTGPIAAGIQMGKNVENSRTNKLASIQADADSNFYTAFGKYTGKNFEAGLLFKFIDNATNTAVAPTYARQQVLNTLPYFKAKLGPVAMQGEVVFSYGKVEFGDETAPAVKLAIGDDEVEIQSWAAWIDATADFGMAYVGGTFAYVSGDDPGTLDKNEGVNSGGLDWNPCLLMFNNDRNYWAGGLAGYDGTNSNGLMTNAYFAQLRGGVRPVDKLDIMASFSWAKADKAGSGNWVDRDYGYEIDLTATYKITNNLSYMLGAGYWFVGDWYYGSTDLLRDTDNNFMVINKLTLTF